MSFDLPNDIKNAILVAVGVVIVFGVGYMVGNNPGPWQKMAGYCDEVVALRNVEIQTIRAQVPQLLQDQQAKFSDAVRLLDNLASAVETGEDLEEATKQARYRVVEWTAEQEGT